MRRISAACAAVASARCSVSCATCRDSSAVGEGCSNRVSMNTTPRHANGDPAVPSATAASNARRSRHAAGSRNRWFTHRFTRARIRTASIGGRSTRTRSTSARSVPSAGIRPPRRRRSTGAPAIAAVRRSGPRPRGAPRRRTGRIRPPAGSPNAPARHPPGRPIGRRGNSRGSVIRPSLPRHNRPGPHMRAGVGLAPPGRGPRPVPVILRPA